MPFLNRKILLMSMCLLLSPQVAFADATSERENLVKLMGELDFLIKRVDSIAHDAPKKQKYFRYDLLRKDLLSMREGIEEYFNSSLSLTNDIKPINATYSNDKEVK